MVAEFLELDKLVVGTTSYNSANEAQTVSPSRIWGNDALLYYYTPKPKLLDTASILTFQTQPVQVHKRYEWSSTKRKVWFVEASVIQGYKVIDAQLGYRFKSIVS